MTDLPERPLDPIEREAHAWVRRLASAPARPRDAEALRRWCARSERHAEAFRRAHRLWQEMLPAARRAAVQAPPAAAPRDWSRRALLGGFAVAAGAAGVAWVRPPALWQGARARLADYRTATGEQRRLELAPGLVVEMNTRSSLTLAADSPDHFGLELIEGEIAVEAGARPVRVGAGDGWLEGVHTHFEVRSLDTTVCVTCTHGQVSLAQGGQRTTLAAGRQLEYRRGAPVVVRSAGPGISSWREGVLSFRETALGEVVAEINRYRPGRVVLLAGALERRPVSGRFRINELDKAIAQIQRLFRLEARALPGGLLLLG